MDTWTRIGRTISGHMAIVAPACVVLGVAFPQVFGLARPAVPLLFAVMTFQGALGNTSAQLLGVLRRPGRLLAIVGVTSVAAPVLARFVGGLVFGWDPALVTGVVLEYSVPVAVLSLMWTDIYEGDGPLALATVLVSTVIAPFTIPLGLQVLVGESIQVDVPSMMGEMLLMIALPALAGTVVNDATHGWGKATLSPAIMPAARILMVVMLLANATSMADYVRNPTPVLFAVAAFILAFAILGFTTGIVLARLTRQGMATTVTMCFCCGLRNIASGAVIAATYFPGATVFPVMMGTLFQQILAATFGAALKRMAAAEQGTAEKNTAEQNVAEKSTAATPEVAATRGGDTHGGV